MTERRRLAFAEPGEAVDLAAFLRRQLGWDRAAAVRLTAGSGGGASRGQTDGEVVAVVTRPARFEVLAVRPVRLREPARVDVTVSAGQLLDGIDEPEESVLVPAPVTGPAWAGMLPPRGGWRPAAEVPHGELRDAAAAVIGEFRARTEALTATDRTRGKLDALAEEIWSRPLPDAGLPLRAVHAAQALGFLRAPAPARVLSCGPWLRLATPLGSIVLRGSGVRGLPLTPV